MRLSISARFTIKDRPEGYLGLTGEHWNFGKDKKLSLTEMCCSMLYRILWYHGLWLKPEEMRAEVEKIHGYLSGLEFYTENARQSEIEEAG